MKNPHFLIRGLLACLLFLFVLIAATGCDGVGVEPDSTDAVLAGDPDAVKGFDPETVYSAKFVDNKETEWTITFDEKTNTGSLYSYHYTLTVDADPSNTPFIALETPSCAGDWMSAVPEPGVNNNANGTIEWHENDLTWEPDPAVEGGFVTSLSYTFDYAGAGELPDGLVRVSFKSAGAGSDVETGAVFGPCSGHFTISGRVLLDTPDSEDQGIEGVTLSLYEDPEGDGSYAFDSDFDPAINPVITLADGSYSFDVWGPTVHSGHYKVAIENVGANTVFFSTDFFELVSPAGQYYHYVTEPTRENNDFVFHVDAAGAIDGFDNGDVASDDLRREYWRVQATGRGNPNYEPELTPPTEVVPLLEYFVTQFGVEDLFDLGATDEDALDMASAVLKTANNNDLFESLRTHILVMGLNWADPRPPGWTPGSEVPDPGSTEFGRGLCTGVAPLIDETTGRCFNYDEAGTRLIIDHAIGALRGDPASPYHAASKAPTGSSETNDADTLSSKMTNDA